MLIPPLWGDSAEGALLSLDSGAARRSGRASLWRNGNQVSVFRSPSNPFDELDVVTVEAACPRARRSRTANRPVIGKTRRVADLALDALSASHTRSGAA